MADLFTSTDVVARLGRTLTSSEAAKIAALIKDASASIRNYTHQTISQVTGDVVRVPVRNGKLRLPQRPVTAVSNVSNTAVSPLYYQWIGDDTISVGPTGINAFGWEPYRIGLMTVQVTYDHGYVPIPDDIVGVGCSIVMRALGREPTDAGITSESIQGYSYSLGAAGAAGAFGLLQAEKDVLEGYKKSGGQVQTAPMWIV